jgi:hypothetical protein
MAAMCKKFSQIPARDSILSAPGVSLTPKEFFDLLVLNIVDIEHVEHITSHSVRAPAD